MNKFSFTCSCGDPMTVEAENREDGVAKMKAMMTDEAIAQHMAEKHAGDPVPSQAEVHAQIEQGLVQA